METLINILRRANTSLEEGWLYLPENKDWHLNTPCQIIDIDKLDDHQLDENDEPLFAQEQGLVSTLESYTVESIVTYANSLDEQLTDTLLLESFLFYYDHDAFLPYSGFKPLPNEEYQQKVDRDFFDALGVERADTQCKKTECSRGAISDSVFCKIHHYEMLKNKPCPFKD